MIAVLADTHGRRDPRLAGRAHEAVAEADLLLHAGDFTAAGVLEAFDAASDRLVAVAGNADDAPVKARLPPSATTDVGPRQVFLVHGHDHSETGLVMAGRAAGADLVISGHTHRPAVVDTGDLTLLNPGSHAAPRGSAPTHAELEPHDGRLRGRIVARDGSTVDRFAV